MSGNLITRGLATLSALVLSALPALAQTVEQRGYITGFGGAGLTTEVTAPFFGGSVGLDATRNVQITADFGRIQDVKAKFTAEDLSLGDREMASEGITTSSSVKMPTNFVTAGIRLRAAAERTIRPYVLLHGGIAHMSPKPKFVIEGLDVTSLMMSESESPVKTAFREDTRPMATAGAGVTARLNDHVLVDVGYKYSTIFIKKNFLQDFEASPHAHDRLDTHRVYLGLGLTF